MIETENNCVISDFNNQVLLSKFITTTVKKVRDIDEQKDWDTQQDREK